MNVRSHEKHLLCKKMQKTLPERNAHSQSTPLSVITNRGHSKQNQPTAQHDVISSWKSEFTTNTIGRRGYLSFQA